MGPAVRRRFTGVRGGWKRKAENGGGRTEKGPSEVRGEFRRQLIPESRPPRYRSLWRQLHVRGNHMNLFELVPKTMNPSCNPPILQLILEYRADGARLLQNRRNYHPRQWPSI